VPLGRLGQEKFPSAVLFQSSQVPFCSGNGGNVPLVVLLPGIPVGGVHGPVAVVFSQVDVVVVDEVVAG
jgi:hypothetical protein